MASPSVLSRLRAWWRGEAPRPPAPPASAFGLSGQPVEILQRPTDARLERLLARAARLQQAIPELEASGRPCDEHRRELALLLATFGTYRLDWSVEAARADAAGQPEVARLWRARVAAIDALRPLGPSGA